MLEEIYGERIDVLECPIDIEEKLKIFNEKYDHFIKYRGNDIKVVCFIVWKLFYQAPFFKEYRSHSAIKNGKRVKVPDREPPITDVVDFLVSIGFPIEKLFHPNIDWYRNLKNKKMLAKKYNIDLSIE